MAFTVKEIEVPIVVNTSILVNDNGENECLLLGPYMLGSKGFQEAFNRISQMLVLLFKIRTKLLLENDDNLVKKFEDDLKELNELWKEIIFEGINPEDLFQEAKNGKH